MQCPACNSPDAYVGLSDVDCNNPLCRYYNQTNSPTVAVMDTDGLSVEILALVRKQNSVEIAFRAHGDPNETDLEVEFLWSIPGQPNNKRVATLSSSYGYFVSGICADSQSVYRTHWLCTNDGIQPNDAWTLEAQIVT